MGNITFSLIVVACMLFAIVLNFYVEIPLDNRYVIFCYVGAVMFIITGIFYKGVLGKKTAKLRRLSGIMILLIFVMMTDLRGVSIPFSWVKSLLFLGLWFFVVYLIITTD
ncbi:hypothetical protein KAI68_04185 [bacterium]|nr:hypothetical protein [bacterium]